MPGSLDSCINNIFEPGNIPASAGTPPMRVLLRDPLDVSVSEAATALDYADRPTVFDVMLAEAAAASSMQDGSLAGAPVLVTIAVLDGVFVDPQAPKTLIGADVLDSGPITIF